MESNFKFLEEKWNELYEMGKVAELYLYTDPNSCIYKIGLMTETLVKLIYEYDAIDIPEDDSLYNLISKLDEAGELPENINQLLYVIRKKRNIAVHTGKSTIEDAKVVLESVYKLSVWFMEVYGDYSFEAQPFVLPEDISDDTDYKEKVEEQERKIQELVERLDRANRNINIQRSRLEREQRAREAAEQVKLNDKEKDIINGDLLPIKASVNRFINYAIEQYKVDTIKYVQIENQTDEDLQDLDVVIDNPDHLFETVKTHIELIGNHTTYMVNHIKLVLDGNYLSNLTDVKQSYIQVSLYKDEQLLNKEMFDITILPFNHWHGASYYPELLCSYVTPNYPDITQLISQMPEYLKKLTGDASIIGYQGKNKESVLYQLRAVYDVLQSKNIAYCNPPASFLVGQKIRLCDEIITSKLGTCLDLTLLYASILEEIDLNPIIILSKGHAYVGVWLEEKTFVDAVSDDGSLISKHLAPGVNEIEVVECTSLTYTSKTSFRDAIKLAEAHNDIEYIIDVKRCRASGVLPLPSRIKTTDGWQVREDSKPYDDGKNGSKLKPTVDLPDEFDKKDFTKFNQWERKLLDLSLRNPLINMRYSRVIPLLGDILTPLLKGLEKGGSFTVHHVPLEWEIRHQDLSFDNMDKSGSLENFINFEVNNKRVHSALILGDLDATLKNLYRNQKSALEESGANTLFITLGLLKWYETEKSNVARYAPIMLLPIDLIRKAGKGYIFRLRDDEPLVNVTLIEKLKQDYNISIPGLDNVPTNEDGIDLLKVLTIFIHSIMNQKRWEVLNSAYIGNFSFSQFVMWNDIKNRQEELQKNKIVKSLIDNKLSWEAQPLEMGDYVSPEDVYLPVPVDSSQLFAIKEAETGNSFVLHGPPGTGKSQTITAMITNALGHGKTVLFVAEKMAALEVVQKRLDAIGLNPFCLELHSNKANKKNVLEQLRVASEVTKYEEPASYARKIESLQSLRDDLNKYVEALHTKTNFGMSIYQMIDEYVKYNNAKDIIGSYDVKDLTISQYEQNTMLVEQLVVAGKLIRHPHDHPLSRIRCSQYSQSLKNELETLLPQYQNLLQDTSKSYGKVNNILDLNNENVDSLILDDCNKVCNELVKWKNIPNLWIKNPNVKMYLIHVKTLCEKEIQFINSKNEMENKWYANFLTQNMDSKIDEYKLIQAKWFIPRYFDTNKYIKLMQEYSKNSINKTTVLQDLYAIKEYQNLKEEVESLFNQYGNDLMEVYDGEKTDWNYINQLADEAIELTNSLDSYKSTEFRIKYAIKKDCIPLYEQYIQDYEPFNNTKNRFYELLNVTLVEENKNIFNEDLILCNSIKENFDYIKEWMNWNDIAIAMENQSLKPVIDAYVDCLKHEEVVDAYKKFVFKKLGSYYIDQYPVLNQFSGISFEKTIDQFKKVESDIMNLTKQLVYTKLASNVPDFTREASKLSELGILQKAIKGGGKGLTIRKLFEQIPNILPRLCPCMLMSPMSAAQYLDPGREPFDLVIFDEASQLPTSKAVGAIARGKNAVIVGDPKQMPPTSFFKTDIVSEEDESLDDLESILDDCLALNMPQSHLLWHYRSRHESLIAFSNNQFYENKLYTFPSVNDLEYKVNLVKVDGVFEKGGHRYNVAEANAVVDEVIRRAKDPELSGQSIGIVTFNINQQNLIDDLLSEKCDKDDELNKWVYDSPEPLFIKNLESVQGDERDVILFSTGYGPDKTGKVSMNFGPLNRAGGWRRLNVAVSRARAEMIVYTSLSPEMIDLSKTKAEGVAALRNFLIFAGKHQLFADTLTTEKVNTSSIAQVIADKLIEKGYKVKLGVGKSKFKIDLGVVDPEDENEFILGILIDGDTYKNAQSTRDREVSQTGILENLGWNTMRVWSIDWWDNPNKEFKRILSNITKNIREKKSPKVISDKTQTHTYANDITRNLKEIKKVSLPQYQQSVIYKKSITSDKLISGVYDKDITKVAETVIKKESPIYLESLVAQVLKIYGLSAIKKNKASVNYLVSKAQNYVSTSDKFGNILWNQSLDPSNYLIFRITNNKERGFDEIPMIELINATCYVLHNEVGTSIADLSKNTALLLGYKTATAKVNERMNAVIIAAIDQGLIKIDKNNNCLLTDKAIERYEFKK